MRYSILVFSCISSLLHASWSEDTLAQMTLDEKIGQLFVAPACPLRGEDHLADLKNLIENFYIGGLILKQGTPETQISMIRHLQEWSKIPLLCFQDAEWGLSMRLSEVPRFPRNMTLGAIQNKELLYEFGREIGRQCRIVGAHVNLAPVIDVNSNPLNPIINIRSFGEDPTLVGICGEMVLRGMQEEGILACAKHFPGHGDTVIDSHVDLPLVRSPLQLLPFQKAIDKGISCVMTAHLMVPEIDPLRPVTFSPLFVKDMLVEKMGFKGLIISDALNMQALSLNYSSQEIATGAFLAGHDILLYGDHINPNVDRIVRSDMPDGIAGMKQAIERGEISVAELDARVLKVLRAKEKLPQPEPGIDELFSPHALALKKRLYREALTLVKDEGLLPVEKGYLLSDSEYPTFEKILEGVLYRNNLKNRVLAASAFPQNFDSRSRLAIRQWSLSPNQNSEEPPRQIPDSSSCFGITDEGDVAIVALSQNPSPELSAKLQEIHDRGEKLVLVFFDSPYKMPPIKDFYTVIIAYEDDPDAQEAAAEALLGMLKPMGKLPVSL